MRAMTRNHTNGHGQWLATGMLMLCVAVPSGAVASDGDLRQQVLERLSDEEAGASQVVLPQVPLLVRAERQEGRRTDHL